MVVEILKSFGLSEYESKALLALLSRGVLTAKEISEIARIPRTSVYDVMNSLVSKGLVEVFGKPLKFKALSSDEIIDLLSKKVKKNLEILRRELPKIGEEIEEVKVYRNEVVVEKLKDLVVRSESIVALITFIPRWLAEILNMSNARKVVISSNPDVVKASMRYRLWKNFNISHGLIIFDNERVIFIFMNDEKIGILSESFGAVQFSKMLVDSVLEVID